MPAWLREWFRDLIVWIRKLVYSIFALFLDQVHVDASWHSAVREAETTGVVVHVLRSVHLVDSLCIHRLSVRNGLRDIGYVYGLEGFLYRPLRWIYRFMVQHSWDVEDIKHLETVLDEGRSAILCLRRTPRTLHARGTEMGGEVIGWLREYEARTGKKVVLVPHCFAWGFSPARDRAGVIDRIFGAQESPGIFRALVQFVKARRSVRISVSTTVVLGARTETDAALRDALAEDLDAARRALTGPDIRNHYRTVDLVLSDPLICGEISRLAHETGKTENGLRKEAEREVGKLMARPFYASLDVLDAIFNRVWPTLYDDVEVEPPDLDAVREAARRGPIIILPTHRSHIDYLLLSWIFHHAKLPVPHIAAGRNLSFWPLGYVFASAGAFFIPRTLVGKPLERAVLRAYAHRLIEDGHHIEIFLEGTRSRSGKMLPLHTGLLEMFLEKARTMERGTVSLLPVALCYERVIEEGHYAGEQSGGSKEPENLGGLLRTSDILASAYGRLVVRFGTPLALSDLEAGDPDPASRRSVMRIAYRMAWEMNRLEALTPTGLISTVMLQCPPLGIDDEKLFECALFYLRMLAAAGKPIASTLAPCVGLTCSDLGSEDSPAFVQLREALYQAIHLLADDELIKIGGRKGHGVYSVPWEQRLRLDYYRNGAIGPLAAVAIVCRVLTTSGADGPLPMHRVRAMSKRLSSILRHEFVFDASKGFEENFENTVGLLVSERIVESRGDDLEVIDRLAVERLAATVEPALETYRIVLTVFRELVIRASLAEWEVVVRSFTLHDRQSTSGQAIFPESRNRSAVKLALRAFAETGVLAMVRPKFYAMPEGEKAREKLTEIISALAGE